MKLTQFEVMEVVLLAFLGSIALACTAVDVAAQYAEIGRIVPAMAGAMAGFTAGFPASRRMLWELRRPQPVIVIA